MLRSLLLCAAAAAGCAGAAPEPATTQPAAPPRGGQVTISIVGTNDLHGHVVAEPGRPGPALLASYVANLRRARAADGGGVVLVDAGDMFQGTLASNLNEGESVIAAYNLIGYDAAAVGNHDFDFGPVGPHITAVTPSEDPRGALRARAAQAKFPILSANIVDADSGKPFLGGSIVKEVAGVKVGIIGASTMETQGTTLREHLAGLRFIPMAQAIDDETRRLRAQGVEIVVVTAHSGLCRRVANDDTVQQCENGEMWDVAHALTEHVDVIVAGHTHAGVTAQLGTTAIIEQWKYGRGFGRVDIVYDRNKHTVVREDVAVPHAMTPGEIYEGAPVVADKRVEDAIAPFAQAAESLKNDKLGVTLASPVTMGYELESPLGNLLTDLMRAARPGSDVTVANGGALREDLPTGDLTYGIMFEAYPFDNRFTVMHMKGADFANMFAANLTREKGILTISGMHLAAECQDHKVRVTLYRENGKPVRDNEELSILTSDFLALGGVEGQLAGKVKLDIIQDSSIREEIIAVLRKRGGVIRGDDKALFDAAHPRMVFPGKRPMKCP